MLLIRGIMCNLAKCDILSRNTFMSLGQNAGQMRQFEDSMKSHYEFVDFARREIYTVEG